MQLPKNYFENLSASRYREYLKLLPNMEQKSTRSFVTLALTFGALSFFGIFAINPTLSTIVDLQKQLSDDQFVDQQLTTKINNLSSLEQQYNQLGVNLTNVFAAVPQDADVSLLSGQIAALAKKHHLQVTTFRIAETQLATYPKNPKTQSFVFNVEATGNYTDMIAFTNDIASLKRLITVESIEIGRDSETDNLTLTLRCRQYFKQ